MAKEKIGQTQITTPPVTTTDALKEAAQRFADAQEQAVVKNDVRTVKLIWRNCQGCNCKFHNLTRSVPINSELKDGDHIYGVEALLDTDQFDGDCPI